MDLPVASEGPITTRQAGIPTSKVSTQALVITLPHGTRTSVVTSDTGGTFDSVDESDTRIPYEDDYRGNRSKTVVQGGLQTSLQKA